MPGLHGPDIKCVVIQRLLSAYILRGLALLINLDVLRGRMYLTCHHPSSIPTHTNVKTYVLTNVALAQLVSLPMVEKTLAICQWKLTS